jgi:integrase
MLNGRTVGATFTTREDAKDWELITRARAASGALPRRTTVREYAEVWLAGYDHAPRNTRNYHADGLKHIKAALGSAPVSEVTPSDITRMLNRLIETRTPALAERVYRTSSALFASAAADGLCPSGSPVRSKRHLPRRQREPKPVLERDQARRTLAELTGWQRDTAVVQLALGARFGEIAGLTPQDVNLARGYGPTRVAQGERWPGWSWCTRRARSSVRARCCATASARLLRLVSRVTVGRGRSHRPTSRSRPGSVHRACASGWPGASSRWRG